LFGDAAEYEATCPCGITTSGYAFALHRQVENSKDEFVQELISFTVERLDWAKRIHQWSSLTLVKRVVLNSKIARQDYHSNSKTSRTNHQSQQGKTHKEID